MSTKPLSREIRFEKLVSVLIALTTIFAATAALLERVASNEAEKANRLAEELSISATTERVSGNVIFSYDWQGAFQTWRELDLLITNAETFGDTAAAERYRALRDRVTGLSPLLQSPYFDNSVNFPDDTRYEADLYYVEAIRLTEQFKYQAALGNSWEETASQFVLQLTFYAVALSLFGLSTTIHTFIRWLFVGLASLIVLFNIAWSAVLFFVPFPELPPAAITAYSQGVGLAYQGRYHEAIELYNRALSAQPAYAEALDERGSAYFAIGNYAHAAADYEAALAAGKYDTHVLWNLGWTYYLLGRYDDAIRINQQALALDPTLIGVRSNQAIALLAQGRTTNAIAEYDLALAEAVRQVAEARARGEEPPASLWYYLDAAAVDLYSLLDELHGTQKYWTQAPPANTIGGDPGQLESTALGQIKRLKEYTVSLEFNGAAPADTRNPTAGAFSFVQEILDANGNFVEYQESTVNAYGINQIGILFDYTGFPVGAQEVWKVYTNGYEDPALRVVGNWALEESGSGIKFITYAFSSVFVFASGEYTVDLYIDSHLVQSGTFYVEYP